MDIGERLSALHDQDAYSYQLAHVLAAAADPEELDKKCQQCIERLPFDFEGE